MLDLFDADGKPDWLEHPKWRRTADVIALRIGPLDGARLFNQPINTHAFDNFEPAVGYDAFVIGFPMHMDGSSGFPIWKRASIATEPDIDLNELPKLLIDTGTRKGMSGSPVIAVRRGVIKPRGSKDVRDTIFGEGKEFLGVYGGRIGDDEMGVQLGVVWKASVVSEIISSGVRGKTPFD